MLIPDYTTHRLHVTSWHLTLADTDERAALERDLAALLTPSVLAPLPEPLQLQHGAVDIPAWVQARADESEVYTVSDADSSDLLGLLILAHDGVGSVHLGYLFGETAWGKGYATELIRGLVDVTPAGRKINFVGGVAADNPASSRVLLKAGFAPSPEMSDQETLFYTWTKS